MTPFEQAWSRYRERAEGALGDRLDADPAAPQTLQEAMRYACLGGGKRFRAMLVYACGELAGAPLERLDTPACVVEMVHAYSLVHDDLPAMDDDDLRRGKPACHVRYGEATAILAGDALQSLAFGILAAPRWNPAPDAVRGRMLEELAAAVGVHGMAGGQALDLAATGNDVGRRQLTQIHRLKTGALIEASAVLGALAGDPGEGVIDALRHYARDLGLAFQVADDILDHEADGETLGKPPGADERMHKSTYVSLLGLDGAKREAAELSGRAVEHLGGLGDNTGFLEQLSRFAVDRAY